MLVSYIKKCKVLTVVITLVLSAIFVLLYSSTPLLILLRCFMPRLVSIFASTSEGDTQHKTEQKLETLHTHLMVVQHLGGQTPPTM